MTKDYRLIDARAFHDSFLNPQTKRDHRRALLFIAFSWYFTGGMFWPFYALFAAEIGGDLFEIGGALVIYYLAEGSLTLLFGHLPKKRKSLNELLLLLGYFLFTLSFLLYFFVSTPLMLFVIECIAGIASAMATPTWDALYTWNISKVNSSSHWGTYEGGSSIVRGIALLNGTIILYFTNFQFLFIIISIGLTIATIYILYLNIRTNYNLEKLETENVEKDED